ncbi:MAG: hypothetical protein ACLU9S_05895 [Oscillospiraceae bacterium]
MSTLSDDERTVTSQLSDALRHVDDVIAGSGLPAARVLASLTLLEVKGGLAVRHPGKFLLSCPEAGQRAVAWRISWQRNLRQIW